MLIEIERPKLANYQTDFLYNNARFSIVEASTKIGKTFACIWWLYEQAHLPERNENDNVWWVAPVYNQAKIAFNRLKVKVQRTGVYKINESNLTITCPNGVIIHFKTAKDVDNLYGEDVYACVFDEAPRAKVEAWYAIRSTITATDGEVKMIGNFGGSSNWMHLLKEKSKTNDDFYYAKVTAYDGIREGILTEKQVAEAKADLPPKIFKQLYMAEEQEDLDQLISFDTMRDLYTNTYVKEGKMAIICDIAMLGSDKFVIGIFAGRVLKDLISIDKINADEIVDLIKSLAVKWKVSRSRIVYDADGLGQYLKGYLRQAKPFHNGGKVIKLNGSTPNYKNLKSQCAYAFAKAVNDGLYYFETKNYQSDVFRELEMLKSYELDKDGKIQIFPKKKVKEYLKNSPDKVDVFTMNELLFLKRTGFATIRVA